MKKLFTMLIILVISNSLFSQSFYRFRDKIIYLKKDSTEYFIQPDKLLIEKQNTVLQDQINNGEIDFFQRIPNNRFLVVGSGIQPEIYGYFSYIYWNDENGMEIILPRIVIMLNDQFTINTILEKYEGILVKESGNKQRCVLQWNENKDFSGKVWFKMNIYFIVLKNKNMKKYIFHINFMILSLIMFGLIVNSGCSKNDYNYSSLIGTWRLVQKSEDGASRIPQPDESECADCFSITFKADSTIDVKSQFNIMSGYVLLEDSNISIHITITTEVGEIGDGPVFTSALDEVSSFDFKGESLRLRYPADNCLLFERK